MPHNLTDKLKEYLEKNKIDRALKEFKSICFQERYKKDNDIRDIYDDYVKISSRYNMLKDNELSNTITSENSQIEKMKIIDKLVDICSELGETLEKIDKNDNINIANKTMQVPIIPLYAAAGNGGDGSLSFSKKDIVDYLPLSEYHKNREYIAVNVRGDSMTPTIESGDILLCYNIRPNEILNDKLYLISEKNNETIVKRITIDYTRNRYILKSDNDNYPDKSVIENDCTFWRVCKIIRNCE